MSFGPGPVTVAMDGWMIHAGHGLPAAYDLYRRHAMLCEEISSPGGGENGVFFLAVTAAGEPWPRLVVTQDGGPVLGGTGPGVALMPQAATLFSGIGSRLLAWSLRDRPRRLWEDTAELGFWHWSVHDHVVLMAAEVEFAAWDLAGAKLWSAFVEPPWSYQVTGDRIDLDVMGRKSAFPASTGPGTTINPP